MNEPKEQFCRYCGKGIGIYKSYPHTRYDTCGRKECERLDKVRLFSHRLDDAAQGITEGQVYELATELRVILGMDETPNE